MDSSLSILGSWTIDPWLTAWMAFVALLYLRGAWGWRRRAVARSISFLAGLLAAWLALSSPLESFASLLLSAHMGQHLLLTMVAPPLLLLGEPMVPLLRGLPRSIRREWISPFIAAPSVRRAARRMVHPLVAGPCFIASMAAWHVPALYELALRDPSWHRIEHLCFLVTAVMFWWPVVQPAPSRAWWPRWTIIPYLLIADIANTVLSAVLCFAPRVLYPSYASASAGLGADALIDQARAGALMWIPGSIVFLVPAAWIVVSIMRPARLRRPWAPPARPDAAAAPSARRVDLSLPQIPERAGARRRFDLLRVPLIGAFLSRRWARTLLRAAMLLGAALIVVDGFAGPAEAPMNLAGTLPWTHWRGATVLLLLAGGNFLCMACPFVLPRMAAQRWWRPRSRSAPARGAGGATAPGDAPPTPHAPEPSSLLRRMPAALRSKWLACGILVVWLVAYEAFDLWASPFATALLIVGYVVAAFAVDAFARSGAFCKWVCPLGQFHFVQSTLSPLTVAVRNPAVCTTCRTNDCLRGNARRDGCALDLFVPRKEGNLDCTFCLDCVDACPHENIGILAHSVGAEIRSDHWRSSLGRLSQRLDFAVLALLLSTGAVVNAAGMTAPMLDLVARGGEALALPRAAMAAVIVTASLAAAAGAASLAALPGRGWRDRFTALAWSSVPLGAAMWLVHFSFHAVTSWRSAGPVMVRAAHDLGVTGREPAWSGACCDAPPSWLLPAELLALSIGLSMSIWTLDRRSPSASSRLLGSLLLIALWAAAAWVLFQPMEMRGTLGWEVTP